MTQYEDIKEISYERQVEIVEFYTLAQKYGFCNPFCECGLCTKELD